MKHILKRFEELGIRLINDKFQRAAFLLTAQYSVLIFILLTMVSVSVYVVFGLSMGITIGDGPFLNMLAEDTTNHEATENLMHALLIVMGVAWFIAMSLSYFLARRTLQPIQAIYTQQEKFVADVAHELRTPLTVLKSGMQMNLRSNRTNEIYKQFIYESLEEVERLVNLSNDLLLLLKKTPSGNRMVVSVGYSALVRTQIKNTTAYAQDHEVTLVEHIDRGVFLRGVEGDIIRMLSNLLKNAIDYNSAGGKVTISLTQEGSTAVLSVADTGIGISEEDQEHIFERFYKADSSRTQKKDTGSGLGLAMVKEIIDQHDGFIDVQSTTGKGTTLVISIPCT